MNFVKLICLISLGVLLTWREARADIYTVTTTVDSVPGSIQTAIINANIHPGKDSIYFNISGTGPFVFTTATNLNIEDAVFIDGLSQPGSTVAVPKVTFQGTTGSVIFEISKSDDIQIRGLIISNAAFGIRFTIDDNLLVVKVISVRHNIFRNNGKAIDFRINERPHVVVRLDSAIIDSNYFFNNNYGIGGSLGSSGTTNIYSFNNILDNLRISNNSFDSSYCDIVFSLSGSGDSHVRMSEIYISNNVMNHSQRGIIFNCQGAGNSIGKLDSIFINDNNIYNCGIPIEFSNGGNGNAEYTIRNILIRGNYLDQITSDGFIFENVASNTARTLLENIVVDSNFINATATNNSIGIFYGPDNNTAISGNRKIRFINNQIQNFHEGISFKSNGFNSVNLLIDSLYIMHNSFINNHFGIIILVNMVDYVGSGIFITNNHISNGYDGIVFDWMMSIAKMSKVVIENNQISQCNRYGIYLRAYDRCIQNVQIKDFLITENSIYNNDSTGIKVEIIKYLSCSTRTVITDSVRIINNSIFANGDKGIRIIDHVAANNFNGFEFPVPMLDSIVSTNGSYFIKGHLAGLPLTHYSVEFFENDSCDATGYGEGKLHLGFDSVLTDATGNCNFSFMIGAPFRYYSATATDLVHYNTSEFGNCLNGTQTSMTVIKSTENIATIYPNPATDLINLDAFANSGKMLIMDQSARVIIDIPFHQGKQNYDISSLKPGLYTLILAAERLQSIHKLIIVN